MEIYKEWIGQDYPRMAAVGRDLYKSLGPAPGYVKHSTKIHVPGKSIQNSGRLVGTVPSLTHCENFLIH